MSCSLNFNGLKPVDVPIAHRKGIRNCTKHPISNHMSCKNLSPSFSIFISQLPGVDVPKNIQEALSVLKWKGGWLWADEGSREEHGKKWICLKERLQWGVNGYSW